MSEVLEVEPHLQRRRRADHPEDQLLWDVLQEVAQLANGAVPGADGVGVTLAGDEGPFGSSCVGGSFVHVLAATQSARGEGPSVLAASTAQVQQSPRLGSDDRWPDFGADAVRLGVESALSLPLLDGEAVRGTVDIWSHTPSAFTALSIQIGKAFATSAALALATNRALARSQRLVFQLNEMMCDRQDVDRAIGILMGRAQCSPEAAAKELQDSATAYGRSLQETSRALVHRATELAR